MTRDYPLNGIRVIDLGQVYQGPYATLLMAKAGADVIKVEPVEGEPARRRSAVGGGATIPLAMLNSNKRGITLNLKSERGKEILKSLAMEADVLLENYAPGVLERLGVGPTALMKANPRLIYASGTGYGLSGPDRDSLAMDLTVQAASGVMSVTGFPDGPPLKAGPAIADFLGGTHLYAAVMTALFERERTGKGRLVEVSMLESVYPTLASNIGMVHASGGKVPPRVGNRHGGLAIAPYNVYPAKDGHIAVICISEDHWRRLLTAMDREDLADDPRFSTNAKRVEHLEETDALVEQWAKTLPRARVFEITRRHRVPSAPVRDLIEVMNDPHMHERGMLEWIDHPDLGRIVVPGSPIVYHDTPRMKSKPSPALGVDNEAILGELLGLDADEVAALKADGVI